jgi:hypothetical protein
MTGLDHLISPQLTSISLAIDIDRANSRLVWKASQLYDIAGDKN